MIITKLSLDNSTICKPQK